MTITSKLDNNKICEIILDRENKKNALDLNMINSLVKELNAVKHNSDVRVVIITGVGDSFSAGGDINEMIQRKDRAHLTMRRLETGLNEIVRLIREIPRPVVAKINGLCFGAGLVIATACDLIYAKESSKFGFSHANIGLIPEASYFISRFIGLHKVKELVFLRSVVTGNEANKLGLINNVFSDEDFDNEVGIIIEKLSLGPKDTIGLAKEVLNHGFENSLDSHLKFESLAQGVAFTTEDHVEGVDAFLNKRIPEF